MRVAQWSGYCKQKIVGQRYKAKAGSRGNVEGVWRWKMQDENGGSHWKRERK